MTNEKSVVLVTGAAGMIGSEAVLELLVRGMNVIGIDCRNSVQNHDNYRHFVLDLSNQEALKEVISKHRVNRIIHLAALAHAANGKLFRWEDYYHFNVECAKNVFAVADDIPVLFISTVDVYGFAKKPVNVQTEIRPVSYYAKSKAMAEEACRNLSHYTIFRFSPVYTAEVKRDIQKRYYLKYPIIAYQIGKGMEYEILNIRNAVSAIASWCEVPLKKGTYIIKDPVRMNTVDCIRMEKQAGRARIVLRIPHWLANVGYAIIKRLTGENKYTYLLSKAVHPLRTE